MDTELMLDVGQANELKLAFRRAGYTNADIKRLCEGDMLAKVKMIVRGQVEVTFSSLAIASGLIPTKWEIIEDIAPTDFKVSDLEIASFLEGGENCVNGEVMRKRAVSLKANLGLADAKRLLDNQSEIPIEFRGKYLVFTGTLLRDSDGNLHIAYLYWLDDLWCLFFDWLDHGWGGRNHLPRCK